MDKNLEEKVLDLAQEYENSQTTEAILAEVLIQTIRNWRILLVSCKQSTRIRDNAWQRAQQRLMAWFGLAPSPAPPEEDTDE